MMLTVLVTGCAGFIGSHLCEKLLGAGHRVIGLDNFSSFYPRPIKERNMGGFIDHPQFQFHELDLRDKAALTAAISGTVDVVAHLAAKAGVRPSISDPEAYIDVNVKGTNNVLELMRKLGCKKLFFASSSSIYGNQKQIPFREDSLNESPISPYAFTKRSCELMNYTYHHLYDFDVLNARFFTVYGPRQRPDLAIHKFVRMAHEGVPISMFGNGETSRDYTFIDDIIDGIQKSLTYLMGHQHVFETINLGNNKPIQLKALIALISEVTGKELGIEQLPPQEGDVDITYADINKAKTLLGYTPKTAFNEGIKQFYDWYTAVSSVL
jgi:UDP-glucuronate 4-epimerase